jgi:hypothetical protein
VGKKKDNASEVSSRTATIGIKLVRIGKAGETAYNPKDIKYFFQMMRRIDPTAFILNAKNFTASAMRIKEMEALNPMEYKTFLDMRSDNWGASTEGKMRTVWMCYVATDTMTPTLLAMRDDKKMKE